MHCWSCGKPVDDDDDFCLKCGAKVEAPVEVVETSPKLECPHCHKPIKTEGQEFCGKCGKPITKAFWVDYAKTGKTAQCPKCKVKKEDKYKYCVKCGHPFTEAKASSPPPPKAETKPPRPDERKEYKTPGTESEAKRAEGFKSTRLESEEKITKEKARASASGAPEKRFDSDSSVAVQDFWPMFRQNAGRSGLVPAAFSEGLSRRPKKPVECPCGRVTFSSPVTTGRTIYVCNCEGKIFKINRSDDRPRELESVGGGKFLSTPALHLDTLYAGCSDGKLYAVDCLQGKKSVVTSGNSPMNSSPVIARQILYACNEAGDIFRIPLNREVESSVPVPATYSIKERVVAAPAADENFLYVATTEGWLHQFKISGEGVEPAGRFQAKAAIFCSPALTDDAIIFGDNAGNLYVLNKESLDAQPNFPIAGFNGIYSSPVVHNGAIVFGSDNGVHAVNVADGQSKWKEPVKTKEPVVSSPVIANEMVFVGSQDKGFYGIDFESGERWMYPTRGPISSSPAAGLDFVCIASSDGNLYIFSN